MRSKREVRLVTGVPPTSVFADSEGTPLVLDDRFFQRRGYFLDSSGTRRDLFASSNEVLFNFVNDGVAVPKGTLMGLEYLGGAPTTNIIPFNANGSMPVINVIGIAREGLAVGEAGFVVTQGPLENLNTTGAAVGETWVVGDILYANPAAPGALTKVKPTAPNVCIPVALVTVVSATTGSLYVRVTIEQEVHYGAFLSLVTHTAAAPNTAYGIALDTTAASRGVTLNGTSDGVVIAESGLYSINLSLQAHSSSASAKNLWFWFRRNGVDIANSATRVTLAGSAASEAPSVIFPLIAAAGDNIRFMWAVDDVALTLATVAATAFAPACPAVIVTVRQVAL